MENTACSQRAAGERTPSVAHRDGTGVTAPSLGKIRRAWAAGFVFIGWTNTTSNMPAWLPLALPPSTRARTPWPKG